MEETKKRRIIVGSAPFFPPLEAGERLTVVIEGIRLREVVKAIETADEVVSFCGHEDSAHYLGVELNREAAPREYFRHGIVWVGIRPVKRPMPGEEVDVFSERFVGWRMTFLEEDR
ncbi:MAG: hypothetical protein JW885_10120 [Deltaproteobacteria bacterium]|nr:hypothetical protein [Candidatus Zymogenaceae bacterium]